MNRSILQRRRQRQRWKRLAVAMGPVAALPKRWRRWARRRSLLLSCRAWLRYKLAMTIGRQRRSIVPFFGDAQPEMAAAYEQIAAWGEAQYRVFASAGGESDAPAGTLIDVEWVPGVPIYVQEVRADGQVDGGFLSAMLTREEGDDK